MAPKTKVVTSNAEWYLSGYNPDTHKVSYEWEVGGDLIKPGDLINIKHARGTFKFRCLVELLGTGRVWFDCLHSPNGASNLGGSWHSFELDKMKGKVKPRRSYKKK
jgi:hypothetical protein